MGRLVSLYQVLEFLLLLFLHVQVIPSLSFSSSLPASSQLCHHDQRIALLQFKSSFSIHSYGFPVVNVPPIGYPKTESWKQNTDCCLWDGVTCDSSTGHVIGLDLSSSWLQGSIHSNSSLFLLHHLQKLDLSLNNFSYSPIPSKFGQLTSLTHLNLSSSSFYGAIPSEIAYLSALTLLDLSLNFRLRFSRDDFGKLSQNLTKLNDLVLDLVDMSFITPDSFLNLSSSLKTLSLSMCNIQGNLPYHIFLILPNLEEFDVSLNQGIEGSFPFLPSNWSSPLRFLYLFRTGLSGQVPISIGYLRSLNILHLNLCKFNGLIPASLGNLTQVTSLDLSYNSFTGQLPSSFGNLVSLTALYLQNNDLSGPILDVFGKLQNLTYLDLSSNHFEGQVPSSVFNLMRVSSLSISSNRLVGPLPNQINGLSVLYLLGLSSNLLNGTMPSWLFTLPSLRHLFLNRNQLAGQISEILSKSLEDIDLSNNNIQGPIPDSIFQLENITFISLSSNKLSGILELDKFSKLKKLGYLDLSGNSLSLIANSQLNSTWPRLGFLGLSSCNITELPIFLRDQDKLRYLNLSHNFLRTVNLSLPGGLEYLDLRSNLIQGTFPLLSNWTKAKIFFISRNNLTGEIPSSICNHSTLQILDISNNGLSGKVPACLGSFSLALTVLSLRMNRFHGPMPGNFSRGNLLRNLDLNGNLFEGPLPQSLIQCGSLEVLDLGNNNTSDSFPHWLDSLPNLQVLILRSNKFRGLIGNPLSGNPFPKLRILDISRNAFTGLLPAKYFVNLKSMMNVSENNVTQKYMGDYYCPNSVVLTIKGSDFEFTRIWTIFASIDLSRNRFEGQIPEVLGTFRSLKVLNLSHNGLSGKIPSLLGNISALESLDLSANKLVGEIPLQLAGLNFLAALNLLQNLLEGPIPQGKQFNTFSNDSYIGTWNYADFH